MKQLLFILFIFSSIVSQAQFADWDNYSLDTSRGIYFSLPFQTDSTFGAIDYTDRMSFDTSFTYYNNQIQIHSDCTNYYNGSIKLGDIGDIDYISDTLNPTSRLTILKPNIPNTSDTSYHLIIGTSSGIHTWSSGDTFPAIFLITSIDSMMVNINAPVMSFTSDFNVYNDLVYTEPKYEKIEQLNTCAVRGYIITSFSIDQKCLDSNKKEFSESTIIWDRRIIYRKNKNKN